MNEIDDPLEIDSRRERGLCPHPTHSGDCRLTGDICSHGDEPAAECPEFIAKRAELLERLAFSVDSNKQMEASMEPLDFSWALRQMTQHGKKMRRAGWNGKGLAVGVQPPMDAELAYLYLEYPVGSAAYPEGARVPWAPSQTDVLAEDWDFAE